MISIVPGHACTQTSEEALLQGVRRRNVGEVSAREKETADKKQSGPALDDMTVSAHFYSLSVLRFFFPFLAINKSVIKNL